MTSLLIKHLELLSAYFVNFGAFYWSMTTCLLKFDDLSMKAILMYFQKIKAELKNNFSIKRYRSLKNTRNLASHWKKNADISKIMHSKVFFIIFWKDGMKCNYHTKFQLFRAIPSKVTGVGHFCPPSQKNVGVKVPQIK